MCKILSKLFLITTILFSLMSCSKDEETTPKDIRDNIIGTYTGKIEYWYRNQGDDDYIEDVEKYTTATISKLENSNNRMVQILIDGKTIVAECSQAYGGYALNIAKQSFGDNMVIQNNQQGSFFYYYDDVKMFGLACEVANYDYGSVYGSFE